VARAEGVEARLVESLAGQATGCEDEEWPAIVDGAEACEALQHRDGEAAGRRAGASADAADPLCDDRDELGQPLNPRLEEGRAMDEHQRLVAPVTARWRAAG
jgi:hypothetical protein